MASVQFKRSAWLLLRRRNLSDIGGVYTLGLRLVLGLFSALLVPARARSPMFDSRDVLG